MSPALTLALSLPALIAADTTPDAGLPHAGLVVRAPTPEAATTATTATTATPAATTSPDRTLEEMAVELGVDARTLKLLQRHPDAPLRVRGVTMSPTVRRRLGWIWEISVMSKKEQAVCLGGEVREGTVHVTGLLRPVIREANYVSVDYDGLSCLAPGFPFVGTLHTHPIVDGMQVCVPSRTDRRSFTGLRRAIVSIVLCGPRRMAYMEHAPGQPLTQAWLPPAGRATDGDLLIQTAPESPLP